MTVKKLKNKETISGTLKKGVVFITSLLLLSCSNSDYFFEQMNSNPVITFRDGSTVLNDTVKLNHVYDFAIVPFDHNGDLKDVRFRKRLGYDGISIQDKIILDSEIKRNTDTIQLSYEPLTIGNQSIFIDVSDSFDKSNNIELKLFVFDNLVPVADFKVTNQTSNSISVNASASYDKDEKWGGEIVEYKWYIDENLSRETGIESILQVNTGDHLITLEVVDNNEAKAIKTKTISINYE